MNGIESISIPAEPPSLYFQSAISVITTD